MAANYVKFLRGSPEAFAALSVKDSDTLYFIYNEDEGDGSLYLGNKLIAGANSESEFNQTLAQLKDVFISENLEDKSLLVYDEESQMWKNQSFEDLIYIGATDEASGVAGFVPTAPLGQTELFLKSDGTWVDISGFIGNIKQNIVNIKNESNKTHSEIIAELKDTIEFQKGDLILIKDIIVNEIYSDTAYVFDGENWNSLTSNINANKIYFSEDLTNISSKGKSLAEVLNEALGQQSIEINGDKKTIVFNNEVLSLKNYGIQYYKYVETSEFEGHYVLQIVDEENPWKENLEPKVSLENGELVLGWFEPSPLISKKIQSIEEALTTLSNLVGEPEPATGLYEKLANVYTKEETQAQIANAIIGANHLKRVIVEDKESIDVNAEDALTHIYMVPTGLQTDDDKYDEYIVIETKIVDEDLVPITVRVLERVGSWEVDLSEYVKTSDLNELLKGKVDKVDGSRLLTEVEATKLAGIESGAQVNIIDSVSGDFEIVNDPVQGLIKQLRLNAYDRAKLDSLVIGDSGDIEISGTVNASNVQGLEKWLNDHASTVKGLSENNLTDDLYEKLTNSIYISSVNDQQMSVTEGKLNINKIEISIVEGLNDLLSNQSNQILDISGALNKLKTSVETNTQDIADMKNALTWHTI